MPGRFEELEALLRDAAGPNLVRDAYETALGGLSIHDALELAMLRIGPYARDLCAFPLPPMGRLGRLTLFTGTPASPSHIDGEELRRLLEVGPSGSAAQTTRRFLSRFQEVSGRATNSSQLAGLMRAAFEEMIDNAVDHGRSHLHPVAAYDCRGPEGGQNKISYSVTDAGIGCLESLRQNPRYSALERGDQALELALRDGVSARPEGGGSGFRPVYDAVAFRGGQVRVRSSTGEVVAIAPPLGQLIQVPTLLPERRGFHVRIEFTIHA